MKEIKRKWNFHYFILSLALLLSLGGGIYQSDIIAKADSTVYVTRTGEKYHTHKCGNGTYYASSLSSAKARGLTACSKCFGGSSYGGNSSSSSASSRKSTTVKPIKINKTSVLLLKGQSTKLKIYNATTRVRWKSSKNVVVSVVANGKIKAKKSGKAIITATVGSRSKKCKVVVEEPKLNCEKIELEPTESKKIKLLQKLTKK